MASYLIDMIFSHDSSHILDVSFMHLTSHDHFLVLQCEKHDVTMQKKKTCQNKFPTSLLKF